MRRPKLLAMETIQFQDGQFHRDLTTAVQLGNPQGAPVIAEVIKRHTNITASVTVIEGHGSTDAWLSCPILDKNHVLFSQTERYENTHYGTQVTAPAVLKKLHLKGSVNLKTGYVSGDYADIVVPLTLTDTFFNAARYTAEETAAVLLHEIGHYVSYIALLTKTVATNMVLAQLANAWGGGPAFNEKESLLMDVRTMLGLKLDAAKLAKQHNLEPVQIVVLTTAMQATRDEFGADVYNENTWEMLADQYAMRQGAGRHLVLALDKANRTGMLRSYRSLPTYLLFEAMKLATAVVPIAIGLSVTWGLGGIIGSLFLSLLDSSSTNYDRPEMRFLRMKHQIVEQLKDRRLAPELTLALTEDVHLIDSILAGIHDRRSWASIVMGFIVPASNKRYDDEALARDLESIAHSDLFVHAAALKLTAATLPPQPLLTETHSLHHER